MRLLLAGIAAATLALNLQPAAAQPDTRHPVCMLGGYYDPGDYDCMYYNMWQCEQAASGLNGWCMRNPWYEGPQQRPRRGAQRRRGETWGRGQGR